MTRGKPFSPKKAVQGTVFLFRRQGNLEMLRVVFSRSGKYRPQAAPVYFEFWQMVFF